MSAKVGAIAGVTGVLVALLSLASDNDFFPFSANPLAAGVLGGVLLVLSFVGHFRFNRHGKPAVAAAFSLAAALGASLVVGTVASDADGGPDERATSGPTTTSGTSTPITTSGESAAPYVESRRYRLLVSPSSYVDLDTEKASLEGGPEYEFRYPGDINSHILFSPGPKVYGRSKVSLVGVDDAEPQKCESSTRPQKDSVSGYTMGESLICFTTSDERLAIITVQSFGGRGGSWDGVFDVVLYERGA
ncbi:hypothetical protein [Saccharothrix sp. HUAS TT1]|uniref:hypothetical protein n=1 Tax=unclassified Saccharothrix TaxID=2593673 RepID=UPI00345BBFF1